MVIGYRSLYYLLDVYVICCFDSYHIIKYQRNQLSFHIYHLQTHLQLYMTILLVASSNGYLTHILSCNYILSNINLESHNFHIAK